MAKSNIVFKPDEKYQIQRYPKLLGIFTFLVGGLVAVWHFTTIVYRSPFPTSILESWVEGEGGATLTLPVAFHIHHPEPYGTVSSKILSSLQATYNSALKFPVGSVELQPVFYVHPSDSVFANETSFQEIFDSSPRKISKYSEGALEYHVKIMSGEKTNIQWDARTSPPILYIQTPADSSEESLQPIVEKEIAQTMNSLVSEPEVEAMEVDFSPNYQVTFTILYGSPPSAGDSLGPLLAEEVTSQFLPLMKALRPLSKFQVSTQIQYYAPLSIQPIKKEGYEGRRPWFCLEPHHLPYFVNSAEWDLASVVSSAPDLQFLIYIPSPELAPLHIVDTDGYHLKSNGFVLPQWGGVAILNPGPDGLPDSSQIGAAVANHLLYFKELMGLQAPGHLGLNRHFIRSMIKFQTETVATLSALNSLIDTITSMEVKDDITSLAHKSLKSLAAAHTALASGNFDLGLVNARSGFLDAEKAFFHPTMVSQMYFPTDAAYALFLPLLLPLVLPLLTLIAAKVKSLKKSDATPRPKTD